MNAVGYSTHFTFFSLLTLLVKVFIVVKWPKLSPPELWALRSEFYSLATTIALVDLLSEDMGVYWEKPQYTSQCHCATAALPPPDSQGQLFPLVWGIFFSLPSFGRRSLIWLCGRWYLKFMGHLLCSLVQIFPLGIRTLDLQSLVLQQWEALTDPEKEGMRGLSYFHSFGFWTHVFYQLEISNHIVVFDWGC